VRRGAATCRSGARQGLAVGLALAKGTGTVTQFSVGNHVRWNSEAGYAEGVIVEKHTRDV
jgi:hypothetical protein